MKNWLEKFCKDVFVGEVRARTAAGLVRGGVDGYFARYGSPATEQEEKLWLERAIWFASDTNLLDSGDSADRKREAILERLEFIRGVRPQ